MALLERGDRLLMAARPGGRQLTHLAGERTERTTKVDRTTDSITLPEGHLARLARRG